MELRYKILVLMLVCFHGDNIIDGLCSGFCTDNQTDVYKDEQTKVYIKAAEFMKLSCCSSHQLSVTWEKLNESTQTWIQYPWYKVDLTNRETCDSGQVFVVRVCTHWDAGHYRCKVKTESAVITKSFTVQFIRCDNMHGEVVAVDRPPPVLHVTTHTNITLLCRGYFGCGTKSKETCSTSWSYVNVDGQEYFLHSSSHDRYLVKDRQSVNGITKETILEITNVQSSDYNVVFHCNLVSGSDERKHFHVQLQPPSDRIIWNVHIIIIASISVAIITIFIVAMVTGCCLHYEQIAFYLKSQFHQLPERDSQCVYDVTLLYSEENENLVKQEIEPKLREFKYKISPDSLNRSELMKGDAIANSFCTIVIYSEAEIQNRLFSHLFNIAAQYNGLNIIVIDVQSHTGCQQRERTADCPEDETLRHLPRFLKTVRWPGTDCKKKRHVENFWASIRSNLPGTAGRRQKNVRLSSSSKPLLS